MSVKNADPLAAALDAVMVTASGGHGKVKLYFGDRPEVLESIIRARRDRKLSYQQIATVLSTEEHPLSASSIQTWLDQKGIQ